MNRRRAFTDLTKDFTTGRPERIACSELTRADR